MMPHDYDQDYLLFQGGMYMLQLIDNYAATYSLLLIAIAECVTLTYVYGKSHYILNTY